MFTYAFLASFSGGPFGIFPRPFFFGFFIPKTPINRLQDCIFAGNIWKAYFNVPFKNMLAGNGDIG